ncbi:hypothetical protein DESME_01760 [Desulfitobacterium metallireducens DSM 15288]|uniref:Uncharacterized protein n=1 Tax=Desulfitobacterium metallireducens DSM 15288 TaxID=871968 RepID=W0EBZ8_9FIRM|nr:hypothetical protein DESME_01760 [Desulfitobacterium metallireducens DSM 15288]
MEGLTSRVQPKGRTVHWTVRDLQERRTFTITLGFGEAPTEARVPAPER